MRAICTGCHKAYTVTPQADPVGNDCVAAHGHMWKACMWPADFQNLVGESIPAETALVVLTLADGAADDFSRLLLRKRALPLLASACLAAA